MLGKSLRHQRGRTRPTCVAHRPHASGLASAGLVKRLGPTEDVMVCPSRLRGRGACLGQAVLMAETSNSRVTLSLTRTPPVSSATFQVTP
jgi:hypothetical protein